VGTVTNAENFFLKRQEEVKEEREYKKELGLEYKANIADIHVRQITDLHRRWTRLDESLESIRVRLEEDLWDLRKRQAKHLEDLKNDS